MKTMYVIIIVAVILIIVAYFFGRYTKRVQLVGSDKDPGELFESVICSGGKGCVNGFIYVPAKELEDYKNSTGNYKV